MPVLEIHLIEDQQNDAQVESLLLAASHAYAEVLESPVERVRVYVTMHAARHTAVGGKLVSQGGPSAPYFHFLVLEGRPIEQSQKLITVFTDLIEAHLGADRKLIRGGCWPIPPHHWGIAGTPASAMRSAEIDARAQAAAASATPPVTNQGA